MSTPWLLGLAAVLVGCGEMGLVSYDDDTGGALLAGNERMAIAPADSVDFGRVQLDSSVGIQELVLTNTSSANLPLIDVYMDEFTSQAYYLSDDLPLPLRLKPGAAFTLELFFEPFAVGEFTGNVVLELDDGGEMLLAERGLRGLGCELGAPQSSGGC